jgi:molecular chaperone HtpG
VASHENFQVDLHGLVDVLSNHLYSSPRVYVRELLQNGVDAITARRLADPTAPARIVIEVGDSQLSMTDSGTGLAPDQVKDFLATIGRSSKRDEIGFAREEFLGQFGIGMLSAFMVAEEVRIRTRTAAGPTTLWRGMSDGRYVTTEIAPAPEQGTTVTITARRGMEQWLEPATVRDLALHYGSALPVEILVNGEVLSTGIAPWDRTGTPGERQARLVEYAQEKLGFTPFDIIDLSVPEAGLDGAAFVLPFPANPVERATHRVYLKRMLMSERADALLPDWAFFVRSLVDTTEPRPTASRESLYDDHELEATREALGSQVKSWLVRLARVNPRRFDDFLGIHHLGVKSLATYDDEMLRLVYHHVPLETNRGRSTLADLVEQAGEIAYVTSVDEFRQVGAVASAQGLAIVNAGYTYDARLIERLPAILPDVSVRRFDPTDLATALEPLDEVTLHEVRQFLHDAQDALDPVGCEVVLREFFPLSLPALYLIDRSAAFAAERQSTSELADDLWAAILSDVTVPVDTRPQLVLNHRSPLVRRLETTADPGLRRLAVEGLYAHALVVGHHPVRPADSAVVNRSFLGLLDQIVIEGETR